MSGPAPEETEESVLDLAIRVKESPSCNALEHRLAAEIIRLNEENEKLHDSIEGLQERFDK